MNLHQELPEGRGVLLSKNLSQHKILANRLAISFLDHVRILNLEEIQYLESKGNYTLVHFKNGNFLMACLSLKTFEHALPKDQFIRIHRSYIVRLDNICRYNHNFSIVLSNEKKLPVSRSRHYLLLEFIKQLIIKN